MQRVLYERLAVKKIYASSILHNFMEIQKQTIIKWSKNMLKKFKIDSSRLVFICGVETLIYLYDPELKSLQL